MDIKIIPTGLKGNIEAISSKSHAHRLFIASALAHLFDSDSPISNIYCGNMSEDLYATCDCLKQLFLPSPIFNCAESGSTLRFLLPIAAALRDESVFLGKGRLPQRPISPLREEMISHGCDFYMGNKAAPVGLTEIFSVRGRLRHGDYTLPGDVSSQYITGLLFALPLLQGNSRIVLSSPLESADYVKLTLQVLCQFGIDIRVVSGNSFGFFEKLCVFEIRGNQKYVFPKAPVLVEGDWSNAAFWLVAGAIPSLCASDVSGISISGLNQASLQGDRAILDIIKAFGASVFLSEDIAVCAGKLCGTEIDAKNIPDLVPILSVLAAASSGTTVIRNAARLRLKESDRLSATAACLSNLGADIRELADGLVINGGKFLNGGAIDSFNDHRIAMTAAIASIFCKAPVIIKNAEAVNKSYPSFFRDFVRLGGRIDAF